MSDYIDRNRLKQAISEDAMTALQSWDTSLMELVMLEIDEIPAADVEPVRRGWWKTFDSSYWRSTQYGVQAIDCVKIRCGLCGRGSAVRTNYCPNCGAKMDLEVENDG